MKSIAIASLTVAAALLTAPAFAGSDRYQDERYDNRHDTRYDDRYDDRNDDRYDARYDNRYDDRYDKRYDSRYGRFDNARVVRVDRIGGYGRDYGRECYDNRHYRDRGSDIKDGAIIGAIAGGALGNQVGKGDGRAAATVAGALIGGLIGQSVDKDNRGGYDRHYLECRSNYGYNNRHRDADYRVTYRYRGRLYTTIMPYHPGQYVRVRLDARPGYDRRYANRY